MTGQITYITVTLLIMLGILALYLVKAGYQLQYLRIKKNKKPGKIKDFWSFDYSDPKERKLRWEAFLLFPMLYAIIPDDAKEELNEIKKRVKRIHIAIYFALIILIVLGIYSEKVFPA